MLLMKALPRRARLAAAVAVPVIGAVAARAFADHQNKSLVTTEYEVRSAHVGSALDGFRIAQVSDLHDACFGRGNEELARAVRRAKPDLIAITGDLIHERSMENALAFVRQAVTIAPVAFVPGNHEPATRAYSELRERLIEAGVTVLEDGIVTDEELGLGEVGASELVMLPGITVVGLADVSFAGWEGRADPEALAKRKLDGLLADAAETEGSRTRLSVGGGGKAAMLGTMLANFVRLRPFRLLLVHRPEDFAGYARDGIDLVLAGHAHGGQWRLPVVGGVYAPSQGLFPRYASGKHAMGPTTMVVSRGLGNSDFPLRLNNRPELVVVTLRSDAAGRRLGAIVAASDVVARRASGRSDRIAGVAGRVSDLASRAAATRWTADGGGPGRSPVVRAVEAWPGRFALSDATEGQDGDEQPATRGFVRETVKGAVRGALVREAPNIARQVVGTVSPLILSAVIGRALSKRDRAKAK